MERADGHLTEVRPITSIFKNVITRKSNIVDKDINDIIQEVGAHQDLGAGSEADWYKRNKGYSEKIKC